VLAAARVALHRSACSRGIQASQERDGSHVSVCGCVRVFECVLSTLPLMGVVNRYFVEGPSLPFYSMQREGLGYSIWMYETRKKRP
jgi:hypothetical protein